MGQFMTSTDTVVVLGRTSYQECASYWPVASPDDPFGAFINPVPKPVVSRTVQGRLVAN